MVMDRTINVPVGDGTPEGTAHMTVPRGEWIWSLVYSKDNSEPPKCNDRMVAAGALESYRYLILECTKEEAWNRIKQMRSAILEFDAPKQKAPSA